MSGRPLVGQIVNNPFLTSQALLLLHREGGDRDRWGEFFGQRKGDRDRDRLGEFFFSVLYPFLFFFSFYSSTCGTNSILMTSVDVGHDWSRQVVNETCVFAYALRC